VWLVVQGPGSASIDHLLARRAPRENHLRAVV